MKRTPWMFPIKANLVHFPPKGHQEKSWLVACPSLRVAPPCEGDLQHKPNHITYIKYKQLRPKLSGLPNQRVTPVQISHASKTEAEKLSYLSNQSMAKLSLGHKRHAGTPVLPLLYPEYRAKTSIDLLQPEQFKAPLCSSLNLYEAPPDPSQRVEIPSGPEHLPKILQAYDYQNEELLHLNQQSTSIPHPDHQDGVLPCPYFQTKVIATPLARPNYETKALTNSKYQARATTLMSEENNYQHRANVTPLLPCLDHWSKAASVTVSNLNPWIKTSAPRSSIYTSKLIASLKNPLHNTRASSTTSSIQCSYCSKVINSGSPCSKPYVASTPDLIIMGKAITRRSSNATLQGKAKPSASEPEYNWHTSPSHTCPDHQASTPSDPYSTLQATSPSCSENQAKMSFRLKNKVTSSATSNWVKALPQNNYWAIPRPDSNSEYETSSSSNEDEESVLDDNWKAAFRQSFDRASTVPSGLDYDELSLYLTQHNPPTLSLNNCNNALNYICQPTSKLSSDRVSTIPSVLDRDEFPLCLTRQNKYALSLNNCNNATHIYQATAKQSSERVSTIPSGPDHLDKLPPNWTQQSISALSQNNCNNAPLNLTHQSPVPWVMDRWAEIQLTSNSWDTPLQIPDKQVKVIPNTNAKEIPPMSLHPLDIQSVGLNHQKTTPAIGRKTPPLPVPNSKIPLSPHHPFTTPGSEFHTKDAQDARLQGSSKSLLEHWEKRFSQLKQVTPPRYQHKRAQSSPAHSRISYQVSSSQSFDQQAKTTEEPNNTQGRDSTVLKYKSAFTEDNKQWSESLPDHRLKPRIPKSSDCHNEVQTKLQYQIPNVQNTKATWSLKYIKPYTIEGGLVPTNTINDIINSIPQEKMKNDIRKQILLRRMRGPMHRSSRHLLCGYKVCLVCASWAPNGCFHGHGSKYSCQARLLAIPMPVPGSAEEMGVKFILQIPQSKTCYTSDFDQPYSPSSTYSSPQSEATPSHHTHHLNKKPYPTSQSEESLTFQQVPLRVPSSNIMFDTDNKQWERNTSSNSEAFRRYPYMKNYSIREEPMRHERNVKSLLERLQRGKN